MDRGKGECITAFSTCYSNRLNLAKGSHSALAPLNKAAEVGEWEGQGTAAPTTHNGGVRLTEDTDSFSTNCCKTSFEAKWLFSIISWPFS